MRKKNKRELVKTEGWCHSFKRHVGGMVQQLCIETAEKVIFEITQFLQAYRERYKKRSRRRQVSPRCFQYNKTAVDCLTFLFNHCPMAKVTNELEKKIMNKKN